MPKTVFKFKKKPVFFCKNCINMYMYSCITESGFNPFKNTVTVYRFYMTS